MVSIMKNNLINDPDSTPCRICLTTKKDDNVSNSSCYIEIFIKIVNEIEFINKLWLCMWCKSALKKVLALRTLAIASEKILHSGNEIITSSHKQHQSSHVPTFSNITHVDIHVRNENEHALIETKLTGIVENDFDRNLNEKQEKEIIFGENDHSLQYMENETKCVENIDSEFLSISYQIEVKENEIETSSDLKCNKLEFKRNQTELFEEKNVLTKSNKEYIEKRKGELPDLNKRKLKLAELKFKVRYLNLEEQLQNIENKKNKYKDMKFQCDSCGIGFRTSDCFEEHNVRHTKAAGPHHCVICKLHFKKQTVLSQHLLSHKRMFECIICSMVFSKWSNCIVHRYKCGAPVNLVVCAVCSKVFSDEYSLKVHMRIHNTTNSYTCKHCSKRFKTRQKMIVHTRIHTGQKPFTCENCSKSFSTNSNLKAHYQVHSNETKHYCVECDTYYKSAKSLKRHLSESVRHRRERNHQFKCNECPKDFSTLKYLQQHIARHSTLQQIKCTQCDQGMNVRLAFAIISSACWSAFQHGYNTGVMNLPQSIISKWIQEDALTQTNTTFEAAKDPRVDTVFSVAVSIYCVGGMIGGIVTGFIADRFGRKGGLLLNNVLVFVAVLFEGTSKSVNSIELLIVGRLLIGVNSGLNAGLAPMYLAEISPVSLRGSIGTVYQLVITMTILLSQALGLSSVLGTEEGWPWLLAATAIPAVLQCATLPICPETPKYLLLNKGQELHAQNALNWLRGDVTVHGEMEEMHQEAEKNKVSKKVTLRELFGNRQLREPLIIAIVVMIAQQLSGINTVINFSTDIFNKVNLSKTHSEYATLGMGAMNVMMTVVSLFLVEAAGRKILLLTGFAGMFVCTVSLCVASMYAHISWVSYLCIALVILFVVMFAVGPGSIPWFLVTELFNQHSRPAASSVAVTVNWTANFIVGLSFLPLSNHLGPYVFIIFAVLQLIFILFIHFKVPETKNKTIEEITAMFRQHM